MIEIRIVLIPAYARTLDAQRDIFALAEELGADEAVRKVGLLRLAVSEEEAEHVRDHAAALRADGFPGETVEREDLPPALQRSGLVACLTDHDGALHPARWYRLLAGAAEAAGARICEGSAVGGGGVAAYSVSTISWCQVRMTRVLGRVTASSSSFQYSKMQRLV